MKHPTRLAALVTLLVALTGSLAAKVVIARTRSLPSEPAARRHCPTMLPPAGGTWMSGICRH